MVFLIAFSIIAALAIVPVFWITSFAHAMGGGRSGDAVWMALAAVAAMAFVGAVIVVGIGSLLAPLFGG
jgi:hypothetical protein